MNVKPKFVYYDIRRKQSVCLIMYTHENDVDTQVLEVSMLDNGEPIELSVNYTYSAAIVNRETKALINDSISCELNDSGNVLIPIDNFHTLGAQDLLIELTISDSDGNQVLVTPFPLWIHVNASILDDAQVTPESQGTVPELLEDAEKALEDAQQAIEDTGDYENLDNKPSINGHELSGNKTSDELGINRVLLNTTTPPIFTSSSVNYEVGDVWVNKATNISYVLTRKTTNDLIWRQLGIKAYLSDSLPPSSENLSFNNLLYQAGDIWIHRTLYSYGTKPFYSLNGLYMCVGSAQQGAIPYNQYNITWYRIDNKIQSAAVNQNGTITFTMSDGSTVTTTGESVIGPQGPAGADGDDYVLTTPDGVTSIGGSAFYNCYSLTDINVPNGVTSIGGSAFQGCREFYDVVIHGKPALSNTNAFSGAPSTQKFYVHRSDLSWFETETNWSTIYAQGKIVAAADYLDHLISIGIDVTDFENEVISE